MSSVILTVTLQYNSELSGPAAEAEALRRYQDDQPADVDLGVTAEAQDWERAKHAR